MPSYIELDRNPNSDIPNASNIGKTVLAISSSGALILKDVNGNNTNSLLSASYSGNSTSASYSPAQLPDITDNTSSQYIGINQSNPQYALDVNGKIGNSQYGNINNIQVDDGSGSLNLDAGHSINLNGATIINSLTTVNTYAGEYGNIIISNTTNSETLRFTFDNFLDPSIYSIDSGFNLYPLNITANPILLNGYAGFGGNVGIKTPTPSYTLDINGEIGNSFFGNTNFIQLDDGGGNMILNPSGAVIINSPVSASSFSGDGSTLTGIVSSSYSNSSSYSRNSLSSSYSPIQLPDITDNSGSHLIGINQPSPQHELDVNGFIGNSQYGNFGNVLELDDSVGNILLVGSNNITINSQLNGNTVQLDDGSGNINLFISGQLLVNGSPVVTGSGLPDITDVAGSVGINTNTPNYTLDVSGSINSAYSYSQAYILTGSYTEIINSSYTLTPDENGRFLIVNSASTATITVPSTLPQGFVCSMYQSGSGQVSVTGSLGVNIRNRAGLSSSYAQYSVISLLQLDTSNYVLQGDIG